MPLRESGEFFALPPIFPNSRIIFISTHLAARSTSHEVHLIMPKIFVTQRSSGDLHRMFKGRRPFPGLCRPATFLYFHLKQIPLETRCLRPRPPDFRCLLKTGGPKENMIPNETGIIMNTGDIEKIVSDIKT